MSQNLHRRDVDDIFGLLVAPSVSPISQIVSNTTWSVLKSVKTLLIWLTSYAFYQESCIVWQHNRLIRQLPLYKTTPLLSLILSQLQINYIIAVKIIETSPSYEVALKSYLGLANPMSFHGFPLPFWMRKTVKIDCIKVIYALSLYSSIQLTVLFNKYFIPYNLYYSRENLDRSTNWSTSKKIWRKSWSLKPWSVKGISSRPPLILSWELIEINLWAPSVVGAFGS